MAEEAYMSLSEARAALRPAPEPESEPERAEPKAVEEAPAEEEIEAVADDAVADDEITEGDPPEEDGEIDLETDSDDAEVDEGQESEPATAVAAPQYLGKEEKELFEKMTPDAKKLFVEADSRREAFVTRKSQELSQIRQAFEQRMQGLDDFITETEATVDYYENQVDWEAAAAQLDPQAILQHHDAYNSAKQKLQQAQQAKSQGERVELQSYVREQGQALMQMADQDPMARALVDPGEGDKRRAALKDYLTKQGVDDATLRWASASALVLGYKAMKYDEAQAKASQSKQLPSKQPANKVVSASPSAGNTSTKGKRLKTLEQKATLSSSEARELMRLRRRAG